MDTNTVQIGGVGKGEMRKQTIFIIGGVVVGFALGIFFGGGVLPGGLPYAREGYPEVKNVSISDPDPALPEDTKLFLGVWRGVWNQGESIPKELQIPATLVVEKIAPDYSVDLIYAWSPVSIFEADAGERRFTGTLSDDGTSISFLIPREDMAPAEVRFMINTENGTMLGVWDDQGFQTLSRGIFSKE